MKTTVHEICSSMALILVCVSMFASLGIAHDNVPPPPPALGGFTDVNKCWASLQSIQGCVAEIYGSFLTGQIQSLGPACCKAFVAIDEACWPTMFPFNPFFPPLIKSYCAIKGGGKAAVASATTPPPPTPKTDDRNIFPFPGLLPPGGFTDFGQCWLSLHTIEGCVDEVYRSFFTGKIQSVGPVCCKAFIKVDEACWPKMFPFNPFFPPLLKSYCATNGGGSAAATP